VGRKLNTDIGMTVLTGANWQCVACGDRFGRCQVDHVRPVHAGGLDIPVNLVCLCYECNQVKSCFWPGHGYHQTRLAYDDVFRAHLILDAEITWLREHHSEAEIHEHIWRWYGMPDGASWF